MAERTTAPGTIDHEDTNENDDTIGNVDAGVHARTGAGTATPRAPHPGGAGGEVPTSRDAVRPRLLSRLDAVRRAQVAVISAPPGFGKRDLVDAWIDAAPDLHKVPVQAALSRDELQQRIEDVLSGPAANDIAVLVVDDHLLASDGAAMAPLVEACTTGRVRLVVATRVRPEIALGALAARGRLVDIDGPELAYTRDEALDMLARWDHATDDETVDQIMTISDGWPVVVDMIARMGISSDHPERLQRLMDSYITDRITRFLPDDDVQLLMHLSTMHTLDPQTASMLSGRADAAAQLSRLQSLGVPIVWDSRNTIRINPMVASYLRRQFQLHEPERATELLLRATTWLRSHERRREAVLVAADARRFDLAWSLIGDHLVTHLHETDVSGELIELSRLMPESWEGELINRVAQGLLSPESLLSHLHSIDASNMIDFDYWGRSNYALFFLGLMRRAGYPRNPQFDEMITLTASVTEDDVTDMGRSSFAALQAEYGLWLLHMNRLEEARERLFQGAGLGRLTRSPWVVVLCLGGLALLHALQGRRDIALRLADESEAVYAATSFDGTALDEYARLARIILSLDTEAGPQGDPRLEQLSANPHRLVELDGVRAGVLSLALTSSGDPRQALRLISAWRDQLRDPMLPGAQLLVTTAAVLAETRAGDLDAAQREVDALAPLNLPSGGPWPDVLQAHIDVVGGHPQAARDRLQPWVDETNRADARATLSLLGIYGVAAAQLGDFAAAADATERARVLAGRLGMEHVGARLVTFSRTGSTEIDLTEAERNVLANLNPNETLGQVAERLFISTNTLKTHLRRIYRKLGVKGREEAIERGRALGILTMR